MTSSLACLINLRRYLSRTLKARAKVLCGGREGCTHRCPHGNRRGRLSEGIHCPRQPAPVYDQISTFRLLCNMTVAYKLIVTSVVMAAMLMTGPCLAVDGTELSEMDELRQNVSALWAEIASLREEVSHHHHGGHLEADHDRIVMDVGVMQHEHHIHHDHTEEEAGLIHPYHKLHHSHDALAHINLDHNHDSSNPHSTQDEHDEHFFHKLDIHSHGHDDHSHGHDDHSHGHDDHSHGHDDHSHGHDDHSHGHDDHSHGHDDHSHVEEHWSLSSFLLGDGNIAFHPAGCPCRVGCEVTSSLDNIFLVARVIGMGDGKLSESQFGFHIHESPVDKSGDCGTAGGHFNPHGVVHGDPTDEIRHTGDLGNIVVPVDGHLDGYIIVDHKVAFSGEDNIIGKSIVVTV
ncbi:Superoxide dismutase copper/zinc binding domain [Trinorchestia longiramus]|nr:Superoxide dismutase copper/zinc binding domain [Trinorchestia longiramus]